MFQNGSYFKMALLLVILFVCYNRVLVLRYNFVFDSIETSQNQSDVAQTFGQTFESYACKSGISASPLTHADSLCREGIEYVDSFRACMVAPLCPGVYSFGFNRVGHVVIKNNAVSFSFANVMNELRKGQ